MFVKNEAPWLWFLIHYLFFDTLFGCNDKILHSLVAVKRPFSLVMYHVTCGCNADDPGSCVSSDCLFKVWEDALVAVEKLFLLLRTKRQEGCRWGGRCKPCLPVIHRLATGGGAAWLGATSKKSREKSTLPGPAKKKVGMDGRVNGDDCAQVTDSHDCNARFLRLPPSTPFHWSDCQLLFHCIDRYMNCCQLTAFNRRIKWALV